VGQVVDVVGVGAVGDEGGEDVGFVGEAGRVEDGGLPVGVRVVEVGAGLFEFWEEEEAALAGRVEEAGLA